MSDVNKKAGFIIEPDYYKDFTCLASECPDTCCKGWNIEMDEESIIKWKELSEHARKHAGEGLPVPEDHILVVEHSKTDIRHQIKLNEKGFCPFLTENGLCSIVMNFGHEYTTKICRDFPRQQNDHEDIIQKAVAVRCDPVLDLLWRKDVFSYVVHGEDGEHRISYPAKSLLDGLLRLGNEGEHSSSAYLYGLFQSFHVMHEKLRELTPCDENGYREYGQEFITEENSRELLFYLESHMDAYSQELKQLTMGKKRKLSFTDLLQAYHDMSYDVMKSFFDNVSFGPDFKKSFYQSRELLKTHDDALFSQLAEGSYISEDTDHKLKLVILEQLFNAVLSVETIDYETVLLRLQWLMVQYLVIRYLLFLDFLRGEAAAVEKLKFRISRIFRVTDLPDIIKVSFFDFEFVNWMWDPSYALELLLF